MGPGLQPGLMRDGSHSGEHNVKEVAISTRELPRLSLPVKLQVYLQEGFLGDSNLRVHSRRANPTKLTPHRVTHQLLDHKVRLHENEVVALATYLRTRLAVLSRVQPWTLGGLVRKAWLNLPRTRQYPPKKIETRADIVPCHLTKCYLRRFTRIVPSCAPAPANFLLVVLPNLAVHLQSCTTQAGNMGYASPHARSEVMPHRTCPPVVRVSDDMRSFEYTQPQRVLQIFPALQTQCVQYVAVLTARMNATAALETRHRATTSRYRV